MMVARFLWSPVKVEDAESKRDPLGGDSLRPLLVPAHLPPVFIAHTGRLLGLREKEKVAGRKVSKGDHYSVRQDKRGEVGWY